MSARHGRRERCHGPDSLPVLPSGFHLDLGFLARASRTLSVKGSGGRTQASAPFNPLPPALSGPRPLPIPRVLLFSLQPSYFTALLSALLLPGRISPFLDPFPHADPFPVSLRGGGGGGRGQ